jgi:large subunit ribosomal protein L10
MPISKNKKNQIISFLQDDVNSQQSVVLVGTKGAEATIVAQTNFDLRKQANDAGLKVQVVKNSLLEKNFKGLSNLSGQTYMAFLKNKEETNEVIVPKLFIKILKDGFKDNLKIVGAIINGEFVDAATAQQYADVPTKDESLGQIAGAINSITAKLAMVIKEIPTTTARAISEVSKTK